MDRETWHSAAGANNNILNYTSLLFKQNINCTLLDQIELWFYKLDLRGCPEGSCFVSGEPCIKICRLVHCQVWDRLWLTRRLRVSEVWARWHKYPINQMLKCWSLSPSENACKNINFFVLNNWQDRTQMLNWKIPTVSLTRLSYAYAKIRNIN